MNIGSSQIKGKSRLIASQSYQRLATRIFCPTFPAGRLFLGRGPSVGHCFPPFFGVRLENAFVGLEFMRSRTAWGRSMLRCGVLYGVGGTESSCSIRAVRCEGSNGAPLSSAGCRRPAAVMGAEFCGVFAGVGGTDCDRPARHHEP